MAHHIKLVVVGDASVHVLELLNSYTTVDFTEESYVPIIFDNLSINVKVDGEEVNLQLWNTQGQANYEKSRKLYYLQTDIFIFVFSLVNIENMLVPVVKETCPDTP